MTNKYLDHHSSPKLSVCPLAQFRKIAFHCFRIYRTYTKSHESKKTTAIL